uniref:Lon N-terminal domain-containing protein n=1 Tax=Chromera velia CCMP2878 TaxID=1169474 RepID=A0A0G4HDV2_9ALVE|eukprot:Cvel_6488.t1-p1 / transcript=Cvel_6488.t1 / gene=Cvel_6488 / organism=Chromera_velia_CCMP2878 / gene_product=hypothetical protein / transcript_product=hypothetical protein / location=Cvel_scaffold318:40014-43960(-) / protein_length=608 / sequence_SO=supercontig / SO=protein_coding / is_pseudo=false
MRFRLSVVLATLSGVSAFQVLPRRRTAVSPASYTSLTRLSTSRHAERRRATSLWQSPEGDGNANRKAVGLPNRAFCDWWREQKLCDEYDSAPPKKRVHMVVTRPEESDGIGPGKIILCPAMEKGNDIRNCIQAAMESCGVFAYVFAETPDPQKPQDVQISKVGLLSTVEDWKGPSTLEGPFVVRHLARLSIVDAEMESQKGYGIVPIGIVSLYTDDPTLNPNPGLCHSMSEQLYRMYDLARELQIGILRDLGEHTAVQCLEVDRRPLAMKVEQAMNAIFDEAPNSRDVWTLQSILATDTHYNVAEQFETCMLRDTEQRLLTVWKGYEELIATLRKKRNEILSLKKRGLKPTLSSLEKEREKLVLQVDEENKKEGEEETEMDKRERRLKLRELRRMQERDHERAVETAMSVTNPEVQISEGRDIEDGVEISETFVRSAAFSPKPSSPLIAEEEPTREEAAQSQSPYAKTVMDALSLVRSPMQTATPDFSTAPEPIEGGGMGSWDSDLTDRGDDNRGERRNLFTDRNEEGGGSQRQLMTDAEALEGLSVGREAFREAPGLSQGGAGQGREELGEITRVPPDVLQEMDTALLTDEGYSGLFNLKTNQTEGA